MSKHTTAFQDDDVLIRSLANGQSDALQYIYKTIYPTVEKMVFKMNGSTDEAYDIFQDTITIVYEKARRGNLSLSCRFSTYVVAIAKHLWLKNRTGKKKNPVSVPFEAIEQHLPLAEIAQDFQQMENNVALLSRCFLDIGEPCASLLKAFYLQNKTMQVITEEFGYTNADNAKTQKYKCLNRLRKLFFQEQDKTNAL
ncbi:MAG: sigma-70 family RNA polymerase sigma factor [Chitinophagaceae bacterium]|nr:sigma-70 family RNA polymerase sigma factor [Chitinophagaceae bacterium]